MHQNSSAIVNIFLAPIYSTIEKRLTPEYIYTAIDAIHLRQTILLEHETLVYTNVSLIYTLKHVKVKRSIFMFQVKGLSMEMSQDAWVKQQTQQPSGDRHQARIKTSPVSGSGNCEVQESGPPQSHTATFAPIMPQYGLPLHGGGGGMGRYAPPAHVPMHPTSHRRPAPPKPSPSQSPHARNYR